jgi:hypothetical protein
MNNILEWDVTFLNPILVKRFHDEQIHKYYPDFYNPTENTFYEIKDKRENVNSNI